MIDHQIIFGSSNLLRRHASPPFAPHTHHSSLKSLIQSRSSKICTQVKVWIHWKKYYIYIVFEPPSYLIKKILIRQTILILQGYKYILLTLMNQFIRLRMILNFTFQINIVSKCICPWIINKMILIFDNLEIKFIIFLFVKNKLYNLLKKLRIIVFIIFWLENDFI